MKESLVTPIIAITQLDILPESEFKHRLVYITPDKVDSPVVLPHNLAGDGQTNAGAFLLRGVERDEDLLLCGNRNRFAIIGHLDNHIVILAHLGRYVDVLCPRLQDIFDEVNEDLRDLPLIGINHHIILLWPILAGSTTAGGEFAVQADDTIHHSRKSSALRMGFATPESCR